MAQSPSIVSLKKAPDYHPERVLAALRSCLEPLGGMRGFVRPGQRVLLKPNLLGSFPAERAATTHPAVVRAAILLVKEAGGLPLVGDSPGMGTMPAVLRATGLEAVLEETGARRLDFNQPHEFGAPDSLISRKLTLTRALLEADVVITLPKLKTHGQMTMTGALKNQYGLIPGALKSQWHFRLQQPEWLAALILDVNRVARPALAILDAIQSMDGQGPGSGRPRFLGALIAGTDVTAVDMLACHLIGQDPLRVPLLAEARKQRFGETEWSNIQVIGEDWRALCVPDFEKIERPADLLRLLPLPRPALNWIRRHWTLRPEIVDGRCTKCGICEEGCPVSPPAIHPRAVDGERLEDDRCIHCYCCHEFCPSHGIELRQPWLAQRLSLNAMAERASRLVGLISSVRKRL